jgi:hypothetical protein
MCKVWHCNGNSDSQTLFRCYDDDDDDDDFATRFKSDEDPGFQYRPSIPVNRFNLGLKRFSISLAQHSGRFASRSQII